MISPRSDLQDALGRSGPATLRFQRELEAVARSFAPGEPILEVEGCAIGGESGLLVLSGGWLVFLSEARPVEQPYAVPLEQVSEVQARVVRDGGGALAVIAGGRRMEFTGIGSPGRFLDAVYGGARTAPGGGRGVPGEQGTVGVASRDAAIAKVGPDGGSAAPAVGWPGAAQASGVRSGPELVVLDGAPFEAVPFFLVPSYGGFQWGAFVRNPRADALPDCAKITMTARAADGSILDTDWELAGVLAPGGTGIDLGGSSEEEMPARLEFSCAVDGWLPTRLGTERFLPFEVVNVRLSRRRRDLRVTGEVVNPFRDPFTSLRMIIMLRDRASGEVVAALDGASIDLAAGGRAAFAEEFYDVPHGRDIDGLEAVFHVSTIYENELLDAVEGLLGGGERARPGPEPEAEIKFELGYVAASAPPPYGEQRVDLPALAGLTRAEDVIALFERAGIPVHVTTVYDAESDPNGRIGSGTSYFAKADWLDERVPESVRRCGEERAAGGTVELFRTPQEAEERARYIAGVNAAHPILPGEYHLIAGGALVRLSYSVPPETVPGYIEALTRAALSPPPAAPYVPQPPRASASPSAPAPSSAPAMPVVLPPPIRQWAADEVVWALRELGVPLGLIVTYTPQTDPILGSPGGYLGKAQFADRRVPQDGLAHLDRDDLRRGGSVEIFADHDQALRRSLYVREGEHHLIAGPVLVRLAGALDPVAIRSYAEALTALSR